MATWQARKEPTWCSDGQNLIDGFVDGVDKLDAEIGLAILIPACGLPVLGLSLVLEPDARAHRRRRSASARRRMSSHATPADSPDRTRPARRATSDAQAASTSA